MCGLGECTERRIPFKVSDLVDRSDRWRIGSLAGGGMESRSLGVLILARRGEEAW